MWLNELKIALVQQDIEKLNNLLESIPPLDNLTDINEAIHLLDEATKMVVTKQNKALSSMQTIKKNIDFLKSTKPQRQNNLNIFS